MNPEDLFLDEDDTPRGDPPAQLFFGPHVPLGWFLRMGRATGQNRYSNTLALLQFSAQVSRRKVTEWFEVKGCDIPKFGMDRATFYRHLNFLKGADLVEVERRHGKFVRVRIKE